MQTNTTTKVRFFHSIQGQILIWFLLLGLVPLLVMGLASYLTAQSTLRQSVEDRLAAFVATREIQIKNALAGPVNSAERRAKSPVVMGNPESGNDLGIAALKRLQADPAKAAEYKDLYSRIKLVLQGTSTASSTTLGRVIADQSGQILVSTTQALPEGRNISTERYFVKGLVASYTGDVIQMPGFDGLVIPVATPIVDAHNQSLGVVVSIVSQQVLANVLQDNTGLGKTGYSFLLNRDQVLLTNAQGTDQQPINLQQKVDSYGDQQALKGNGAGEYVDEGGTLVIGAWRYLPEVNWGLVAELDQSEAYEPAYRLAAPSLAILAGAALLTLLVAYYVARRVARPIGQVTDAVLRIAAGSRNDRINVDGRQEVGADEVGQLAIAFNAMSEAIQNREAELRNQAEELRIVSAQAREASRLKDEFLAVMSHELRTPLNAIIGFTGVLSMSKELDSKALHKVRRIRANGERLLALINDILDISRIESGRMQLSDAPISIRRLVEKLNSQMSVLAEEKGLTFNVLVDDTVPEVVQADQDALTKIATNLLSNAFKFTEKGEVRLFVNWQEGNLVMAVSDTGIGIPAHMTDTIFESFRQVDSSSTRKYGGSGLGLSIVQHLCRTMNGTVKVNTQVDLGSTFTVTLPVHASTQLEGVPA